MGRYRYFPIVMAFFVASLLISNVAAAKVLRLFGGLTITGGVLVFPLSYIFGDILTEVYGYRRSRVVIWTGFAALALMIGIFMLVGALPGDARWIEQGGQEAWDRILGQTPRIALGSLVAYWAGEFLNSYVLARLKVKTEGRWMGLRFVASTLVGEGVDSLVFVLVAFGGVFPGDLIRSIILSNYTAKVLIEVLLLPVTYRVVAFLKEAEQEDYYDRDTDFNPFRLELPAGD
ncbi:MAG: queuosine precursor transporter [Bacillota bacterium]|nr:MAG: transporter [Bacillota bacterium]